MKNFKYWFWNFVIAIACSSAFNVDFYLYKDHFWWSFFFGVLGFTLMDAYAVYYHKHYDIFSHKEKENIDYDED